MISGIWQTVEFSTAGENLSLFLVSQDLTQIFSLFLSPDSALGLH
jgi:hypothetical protein